ncbi:MAG: DUF1254 domain-containing protein [bacterium]
MRKTWGISAPTFAAMALWALLAAAVLTSGCAESVTPDEAKAIARDAYVYGFPLVMNCKTVYEYVVDTGSPEYKGPFNQVSCAARLFTPEDRAVVTPNSDTPYCMFWLDLRTEPMVVSVPEIESDRYYSIQLIDWYTHNFAYIGTRVTGNDAGSYLLAGPGWSGETPEGIAEVITSETDLVFVVIRTQLFGADDLERVKEIQAGYGVEPLSSFLGEPAPAEAPPIDFPEWEEGSQYAAAALEYLDFALDQVQPHPDETDLMARFARIGIGTPREFDPDALDPEMAGAIEEGVKQGLADIKAFLEENSADPLISAYIFGTREFLKEEAARFGQPDFYLQRSMAALSGLYGNSGEEAVYPIYTVDSEGAPLDASKHGYVMRLEEGALPPAEAFWSLTMYDAATQLFIHNPLDRYLLNSAMLDEFVKEKDGTIVFYIQEDSPGRAMEANWLPAPDGPFYMVLRLYIPEPEVLSGEWTQPALVRAE